MVRCVSTCRFASRSLSRFEQPVRVELRFVIVVASFVLKRCCVSSAGAPRAMTVDNVPLTAGQASQLFLGCVLVTFVSACVRACVLACVCVPTVVYAARVRVRVWLVGGLGD